MLEGTSFYHNDTLVICFEMGKEHGVQPNLFSRGTWRTNGAGLSVITLATTATILAEEIATNEPCLQEIVRSILICIKLQNGNSQVHPSSQEYQGGPGVLEDPVNSE